MAQQTTIHRHQAATAQGRLPCLLTVLILAAYPALPAPAGTTAAGTEPNTEPLTSIRSSAQAYVRSLLPLGGGVTTVTVGELDGRLRLARCQQGLSATLPAGVSVQARMTVGVSCTGPSHWTVFVPVTIESTIEVLVLTRPAARDTHLNAADVTLEKRKTAGPGAAYLTAVADLSGRTVRRPLAAGTTLAVDMFTPDLVVHRGQAVTLLSSGGAIEVRASGRALADAAAGARIQVQNLSSMRIVEGVVENSDLVRVSR